MSVSQVPVFTLHTSVPAVSIKISPLVSLTISINGPPNSAIASTKPRNFSQITASGKVAPKESVSSLLPML